MQRVILREEASLECTAPWVRLPPGFGLAFSGHHGIGKVSCEAVSLGGAETSRLLCRRSNLSEGIPVLLRRKAGLQNLAKIRYMNARNSYYYLSTKEPENNTIDITGS